MSGRDLVVLGTACAAPTRGRNQNGYLLRMDGEQILFDPGEGTQRQFSLAGISAHRINRICISHLHGDHCLGLPGMLQRLALEGALEVPIHFPASAEAYVERLCRSNIGERPHARLDPVAMDGSDDGAGIEVTPGPPLQVTARPLDHVVDTLGWRVQEPPARHLLPRRLDEAGVRGPAIGALERAGSIDIDGRRIELDDVSEIRAGHAAAVLMDTRRCDNAVALAEGADLVLCEATFLESEAAEAAAYGHLTAAGAAAIARDAGARLLVLTHFSSRYDTADGHRREAEAIFPQVVIAEDLDVIALPR